ncbi:MFS transporter [Arthrobacter sp. JSM 101049]|uniref:MFS transporter n=1 Tax=Arthrobacter sp. JSM 101049 TaxID=929097 RepID=UPI00356A7EB2
MSAQRLEMRGPIRGTKDARRVAVGSSVGAVIETYDFIGFGTAAALYFGHAFFPGADPVTGTLASFATLGVGFAARPLGGILGGHLGDRLGRKPVLVGSLVLMGLATFAIGLLPTYATVGLLAPALLVFVRIVQGLAFGAEWGGAILMSYEHAPWRRKGKFTGIVQAGFPVGLLLANIVFLYSVHLPGSWAWRVPFLASILLVAVGLIIRSKVPESPVFQDVKSSGDIARNPIVDVIRSDWRNIVRGIGLRIAETAGYAVSITYMISYLHTTGLAEKSETLVALCIASAIGIFATMGWGALTDKVGRRPVYIASTAFAVLFGIPMFLMVNSGMFLFVIATVVISYAVCQNSLAGAQGAWFPELFQARTRSSGASLAYQISAMVSGFTPFITTLLFMWLGWMGPALLFSAYGAIGLWAALVTRETWGLTERRLAAEAEASASDDMAHCTDTTTSLTK